MEAPTTEPIVVEAVQEAVVDAVADDRPARRRSGSLWHDLLRDKLALGGAVVLLVVLLCAVFASLVAPHDPTLQSLTGRLQPPAWVAGGSWDHVLGTDSLGRDVLSRVIHGSRVSLLVAAVVVALSAVVGVAVGLVAGYRGGWVDTGVMWLTDTQIAFPGLLLAFVVVTAMGPGFATVVVVTTASGWVIYARMARGIVLSTKEVAYVDAAITVGCKSHRILMRHILPNLAAPIFTLAVLDVARVILAESALSFLGLGIRPPDISWGLDVATGRTYIFNAWWLVAGPGVALCLTLLAVNLVASWFRVVVDPQQRDKRYASAAAATEGAA